MHDYYSSYGESTEDDMTDIGLDIDLVGGLEDLDGDEEEDEDY